MLLGRCGLCSEVYHDSRFVNEILTVLFVVVCTICTILPVAAWIDCRSHMRALNP